MVDAGRWRSQQTARGDGLHGPRIAGAGRGLPIPDREARRRLIWLYRGRLILDLTDAETVITRTDGVTASFLKELLRRAALVAAEELAASGAEPGSRPESGSEPPAPAALRVTDAHLTAALDQLLDTRSQLTRILLGGHQRATAPD